MSSLYDRIAAKPRGGAALAAARLRRETLVALHEAFEASGLASQSALARRLNLRRSAVNQVLRGDGNLRINTLAEYLYALGFELNITMVQAGEPRQAELEGRYSRPAFAMWNTTSAAIFVIAYSQSDVTVQTSRQEWPIALPGFHSEQVATVWLARFAMPVSAVGPVPESTSRQFVLGEIEGGAQ
jgi:transcriptional regulator with XRE-family HTH domain